MTCKAANTYVSGGTIRKLLYGFLFAFRSNYVRNLNYFADKATCWSKIAIFSQSLAFDAPLRGSYRKIAIMFGMEKLEWCGYLTVKKNWGYVQRCCQNTGAWQIDGPIDGRTDILHSQRTVCKQCSLCSSRNSYRWVNQRGGEKWWGSSMLCRAAQGVLGTRIMITGLTQGLQYVIRIAAVSVFGRSNYTEIAAPVIPKPAPSSFSYFSLNNMWNDRLSNLFLVFYV